ncbi:MAG: hypothetical protein ABI273_04055, partial [Lacunisphaera sp.]
LTPISQITIALGKKIPSIETTDEKKFRARFIDRSASAQVDAPPRPPNPNAGCDAGSKTPTAFRKFLPALPDSAA